MDTEKYLKTLALQIKTLEQRIVKLEKQKQEDMSLSNKPELGHPVQPIYLDEDHRWRFKKNSIVRYLLDSGTFNLAQIDRIPFSVEDKVQFYMLIGYSVGGFGELDWVSTDIYEKAMKDIPVDEKLIE